MNSTAQSDKVRVRNEVKNGVVLWVFIGLVIFIGWLVVSSDSMFKAGQPEDAARDQGYGTGLAAGQIWGAVKKPIPTAGELDNLASAGATANKVDDKYSAAWEINFERGFKDGYQEKSRAAF